METLRLLFNRPWLYLAIILLGTFLKFYRLDGKLFWDDEIATIKHTSGISLTTYEKLVPVNEIKPKSYYESFLHLNSQSYTIPAQISGILHDTHLTPAHYVFLTFWHRLVGDNAIHYRLFSVFIFIITLPFLFLLAKLLFQSSLTGWISTSLFAVSPFINLFAQESRYYILWVFSFILCDYLFLYALKQNTRLWWIMYSVSAVLALYTSVLSGLFLLGHFLYIFILRKEIRLRFTLYFVCIFIFYLPWLYFLFSVRDKIEAGLAWQITGEPFPLFSLELLISPLIGFVKAFFFLFEPGMYYYIFKGKISPDMYFPLLTDILLIIGILYAIYYLITKAPKEISLFLVLIILPHIIGLYIIDLVRHGFVSHMLRYQILIIAGIGLVVTYLLSNKIANGNLWFSGLYIGLIIVGLTSIYSIAGKRCWLTRDDCEGNWEQGQFLSQTPNSLIITDFNSFGQNNFLVTLNAAKTQDIDILYADKKIREVKDKIGNKAYSRILVVQASDSLVQKLKAQFGENMTLYNKPEVKHAPPIWQVKL